MRLTHPSFANMQRWDGPPTSSYAPSTNLWSDGHLAVAQRRRPMTSATPESQLQTELSSCVDSDYPTSAAGSVRPPQSILGCSDFSPPRVMLGNAAPPLSEPSDWFPPVQDTMMCGALGNLDPPPSEPSDGLPPVLDTLMHGALDASAGNDDSDAVSEMNDSCSLRPPDRPSRARRALEFSEAFDHGLLPLASKVLEVDRSRLGGGASLLSLTTEGFAADRILVPLLATMPDKCLRAAIGGDYARQVLNDRDAGRWHTTTRALGDDQPAIYLHEIVDDDGYPPTAADIREILRDIRRYCKLPAQYSNEDYVFFARVDNACRMHLPNGRANPQPIDRDLLRYLSFRDRTGRWTRNESRRLTILRFCENLHQRLGRDRWLALTEVGYATAPATRLDQHARHESSNASMNVFTAVATNLFDRRYRCRGFILCPLFDPLQAAIAEQFFTGLAQAYVEGGSGFNDVPAGRSLGRLDEVSITQWQTFRAWTIQRTQYNAKWSESGVAARRSSSTNGWSRRSWNFDSRGQVSRTLSAKRSKERQLSAP